MIFKNLELPLRSFCQQAGYEWQGMQVCGVMPLAVKLKRNVLLQAEGLGSKTSKGGFTKDKVREMSPCARSGHGGKARVWINLYCHSQLYQEHVDINLVFLMLHLSVRSWFIVGILFSLKTPGTLGFYCPVLFL